jgi:arsenite/tail-anchored protein-transporting ATPase
VTNPSPNPTLPHFLTDPHLALLVFGGKGGVGKTTCATAAAIHLALARPSDRFLLVSTDPAHSTRDALGTDHLPPNLELVEIDAEAERAAFMADHAATLTEIATRGTFLDRPDIEQFLRLSLPGIDELAAFLKISRWTTPPSTPEPTHPACVIVDTAPTGHALRLLELPRLIDQWLDAVDALLAKHRYMLSLFGKSRPRTDACEEFLERFRAETDHVRTLLTDPARCRFIPVMLAEAMSAAETDDLLQALDRLRIAAPEVLVNRLIPADEPAPALHAQRLAQAAIVAAPAEALARRARWGLPLSAAEFVGTARLAALYASTLDHAALLDWSAVPPGPDRATPPAVSAPLTIDPANRLIVVVGKGGVGKTTVSSAVALALASPAAGRTLLVSVDPAHSVADCLNQRIGPGPQPVAPGLWAMELDASTEFETFRRAYQDELAKFLDRLMEGVDLAFDRDVLERLLDLAPPGLDEVMALVKVTELLDHARPHTSADPFDRIILDTAPSGHSLRLLTLPALIEDWLAGIFRVLLKHQRVIRLPRLQARLVELSKGLKRLRALLADPASTSVLTVTIPTQLALAETADLVQAFRSAHLPITGVIVNLLTPPEDSPLSAAVARREADVLARLEQLLDAHPSGSRARIPLTTITRGREPRGLEPLSALADNLFSIPSALPARAAA